MIQLMSGYSQKSKKNLNEAMIVCFFNANGCFGEEWDYDNALPQERAFSICYATKKILIQVGK